MKTLGKVDRGVVRKHEVGQDAYKIFATSDCGKPVQSEQVGGHMRQEGEATDDKAYEGP